MNFSPDKLFIGLIDFFSILLPGALLTYAGKDWAYHTFVASGEAAYALGSTESLLVFLFASYLLGHLVFLLGALLDEWPYDWLRKRTDWGQIGRLADGKRLSRRWLRRFARSVMVFGRNPDAAVVAVQRLKARALSGVATPGVVNGFQWAKARLSKEHPEGLATVQRFEADSKFFRSLIVVLIVLAIFFALRDREHQRLAAVCVLAIVPALWRYVNQRFKATQQAYWLTITLDAAGEKPPPPPPSAPRRGLRYAGGVVVRDRKGAPGFLLVLSDDGREEWVLPKGHIEPGESPREAAVREVREETGHWARVCDWLGDLSFGHGESAGQGRVFLMELQELAGEWRPEDRRREWFGLPEAKEAAFYPETKAILEEAAARWGSCRPTKKGPMARLR